MRVVHVHQATVRGGLLHVVGTLVAAQCQHHEISAIGPQPPSHGTVDHHDLVISGNGDFRTHLRLARILRHIKPDVIELHAGSPGELALAAAVAQRVAPAIVVEHLPTFFPLETRRARLLARWAKRRASAWVSVSGYGARHLEARWAMPEHTLRVVPNGVAEPADTEPEPALKEAVSGRRFVMALGAPQERKGYDVFVALAREMDAEIPDLDWHWIGAPSTGRDGTVTLWPWQPGAGWLLRRAEALLVPSRAEGCPLVVLEAFACGTPVLAGAVGGLPELIDDGGNGLLAEPDDRGSWERQLRRLIGDEELRRRLAAAGRDRWSREFTAEAMAGRHEQVIEEVVGERRQG